jgi:uncharacterized integral membrane protein (TIGR00698 family)
MGHLVVAVAVALGFAIDELVGVSPLVVCVLLGACAANAGLITPAIEPGVEFAARHLLRAGVVLLGLRLSFDDLRELGVVGVIAVVAVVSLTFAGVQLLARALGLSPGLGLLTATGYSICGASAVAAMQPLSDADGEETAYAIGLVTLCGTLSIAVLPLIGHLLDLSADQFGAWAGAAVHDVGQVTATASAYSDESLATATVVKLTRVVMLAPMVAGVGLLRRRTVVPVEGTARPPVVPLFVVGFLAAIALRATGWLSDEALDAAKTAEQALLAAGMFGLGAGVRVAGLRALGGRPLVLGVVSWVIVAVVAFGASVIITA